MGRHLAIGVLTGVLSLGAVFDATATTLLDPIVRTKAGGGSIPINALPFSFDFGTFPDDPDGELGTDCFKTVNFEFDTEGLDQVTCTFQNLSGEPITLLDFDFGGLNDTLTFQVIDEGGFFGNVGPIDQFGALFTAGELFGIPSFCEGEGCNVFSVDLIGFLEGSTVSMSTQPDDVVPEPASLMLLGTGLTGLAFARRRRRG